MGKQKVGNKEGIGWTDETVNPLVGCKPVDGGEEGGCRNCWASDMSPGLLAKGQVWHDGLTIINNRGHGEWTGKVHWKPEELKKFKKGKPRRIFLNSISDTFYEKVKREWQDTIFKAMRDNPQHEYQLLTKRTAGMLNYVRNPQVKPMSNVLMGFSAENQRWFDERWKYAKEVAERGWRVWVSIEPQTGPITLGDAVKHLAWVVIGGDNTKPHAHAREFDITWAESLIKECKAAGVPVFMKQTGVRPYRTINGKAYKVKVTAEGKIMAEWPETIRVQEFPASTSETKTAENHARVVDRIHPAIQPVATLQ